MGWIDRIKKNLYIACELLEVVAAILMGIGVILTIVGFFRERTLLMNLLRDPDSLILYVERVFSLVIGIEFLQMLCKPDTDNVIEIIIFLVARHMIVGETTPVQDLISILGIAILIVLRWVIHDLRRKRERDLREREKKEADWGQTRE